MSVLYGHSCKLYETIIENWRLQILESCDFVQNDKILGINNSQKWYKWLKICNFFFLVCRDSPCVFGICVPTERKSYEYKCVCQPGYTGDKCDQVVGEYYHL